MTKDYQLTVKLDASQAWRGLLDIYRSCLRAFPLTPRQRVKVQREMRRIERKLRRPVAS